MTASRLSVAALLALILILQIPLVAQTGAPTMTEIQQDFDAQKYQDVVRKVGTAINLKGNAAVGLDRGKLLALRGESYLRLKQFPNAGTAFTAAVKEGGDSKNVSAWSATALLITRSPGGKYIPKQPSTQPARAGGPQRGQPIDIVEAETRKAAFAALFNDEYKTTMPKIQQQTNQQSIPPLVEGIKQAGNLRNLEIAGTGSDDTVKELITDIGGRASKLMGEAVRKMSGDVETISRTANEGLADGTIDPAYGGTAGTIQKRGLTTADSRVLSEVLGTCNQIGTACDQLAVAVGSDKLFATVKEDAARLSQRAADVANTNYSGGNSNVRIQRGRSTQGNR